MTTSSVFDALPNEAAYMVPASFAQQRLWFLDQLEPQSAAYNIPTSVQLNLPLDVEALERSLDALIERHEVLRTTFGAVDGQPVQVISPSLKVPLQVVDLSSLSEDQREAEALRLAKRQAESPFDLAKGPLLRTTLLKLADDEYTLLLTIHHIISDGWSLGVLYEELAALYGDFSRGQSSTLPDLPIQYADFAIWQKEQLQGEALAEQLAYWKQNLAGAPATLNLPTDRPHPAEPSSHGSAYHFTLPTGFTEALKTLSRKDGATLYMTLVAAFQTLLYRYTSQDDIVVGSFAAGRTRAETEALIGFFVNTLVLRTDLSGNPTFRDVLKRVREVVLEAFAHQDVPFDYLVRELRPARSLGQNPLFQVMLVLAPPLATLPAGWDPDKMAFQRDEAKFDLSLELADRPEGLICRFEYSTDLFDASTISRMAVHWRTLLEGIVANPDLRLPELPLLSEAEGHQLLMEWNDTAMNYSRDQCLHRAFEALVDRTPDAVAVVYGNDHLTYRELNSKANQLARYLRHSGVRSEMLVGIYVERSLDMMVGLLGILKSGGAYVPLDPTYPAERLAFMIEDAGVSVLLAQQRLVERLPRHEARVISLDTEWEIIARQSKDNEISSTTGENLAYMLYTSGSTGKPKGVLGTHRASINRFNWMWETYPLEAGEVCCQKTSLSFVDSIWEIFGPLLRGIRTVIISDTVLKDPRQMLQTLATHSISRIVLVPSLLRVLLDAEADLESRLPHLKYCISSGEALSLELAQRFLKSMPNTVLINLYGSSEVAADATCYKIRRDKPLTCVPIGRPIANTQIYLLDRHLQLVPTGVPGELHIGGDGLARGYFNRPELTAERFIRHPFSDVPGARLYKTGDWARYHDDGNIELIGRLDHQVKIRGFRIELGEIEAALSQHPTIQQAVVVVREDVPGDKRLVAYTVAWPSQMPNASDLRGYLKAKLPDYMVPSAFVSLEALPLTPNGKVDRRALPSPDYSGSELFVAPRTQLEEVVAACWSQMLGVERVGIHDDFFDLGGHSLLAMQVISRLRTIVQVEMPLRSFFESPTVAQLAETVAQLKARGETLQTPTLRARSREVYRVSTSSLPSTLEPQQT
jgi:amino acid adenylation domain-containing protein